MISLERAQSSESDHALINRYVQQDDAEAFSVLMRRYADMVYATCRRVLGNEDQAADAVQETFFQLVKNANRITGSLGSWLHRVATRRSVDMVRQNASRRRRENAYVLDGVDAASTWSELEPMVDEALDSLPEQVRELLLLYFLQGRSTIQIAAAQGISQPAVSRRLTDALQQLRQALRRQGVVTGLMPLQALLLQTNQVAPQALHVGLGKIALANASLGSALWASSASAPTTAIGTKLALTGIFLALAAASTWVAEKEFNSHSISAPPATTLAQSVPAAPAASDSAAPAATQPLQPAPGSNPVQPPTVPQSSGPDTAQWTPDNYPPPAQETLIPWTPVVLVPFWVSVPDAHHHSRKHGANKPERPIVPVTPTNAPTPLIARTTPPPQALPKAPQQAQPVPRGYGMGGGANLQVPRITRPTFPQPNQPPISILANAGATLPVVTSQGPTYRPTAGSPGGVPIYQRPGSQPAIPDPQVIYRAQYPAPVINLPVARPVPISSPPRFTPPPPASINVQRDPASTRPGN